MNFSVRVHRQGVVVVVLALCALAGVVAFQVLLKVPVGSAAEPEGEAKARAVLEDMFKNQREGMMNVPPTDGALLRSLVASPKARRALESGASNGYSGIWTALGLRENGGKLTTLELDAKRAALARENFHRAGVEDTVQLIEGAALKQLPELEGRDRVLAAREKRERDRAGIGLAPLQEKVHEARKAR